MSAKGTHRHFKVYGQYHKQGMTGVQQQQENCHEQKLVFVGVHLDKGEIQRILDDCLVSDEESSLAASLWLQWGSLWDSLSIA